MVTVSSPFVGGGATAAGLCPRMLTGTPTPSSSSPSPSKPTTQAMMIHHRNGSCRWKVLCLAALVTATAWTCFDGITSLGVSLSDTLSPPEGGGGRNNVGFAATTTSSAATRVGGKSDDGSNRYHEFYPAGTVDDDESCRFYLAESSLPNGGLGLFTTADIPQGHEAQPMPDICIYAVDAPDDRKLPFHTHSWGASMFNGRFEGNNPRAACEGFATLVNTAPRWIKTSDIVPMPVKTNAGLTRSKHPNAGAVTQYYGATTVAVRDVPAGSEMTITYGESVFSSKKSYDTPFREVQWIRKHGWCADNVEIGAATDAEMGRGAFARRSLREGSLVAPAPLQFFPNRTAFAGLRDGANQQQHPESVFVNYCFQVPGTSILVYPYGVGVNLINHGSGNNGKKANVGIRWSESPTSHRSWLDLPLDDFWKTIYPGGVVMEYYALRDIREGEELLLDYGSEWESAWRRHVENWSPPPGADEYVYPADMVNVTRSEPFRTLYEQEDNPYPKNLMTMCHTDRYRGRSQDRTVGEHKWTVPYNPYPVAVTNCYVLKRYRRVDDAGSGNGSNSTTGGSNNNATAANGVSRNYVYDVALEWGNDHVPVTLDDVVDPSLSRRRQWQTSSKSKKSSGSGGGRKEKSWKPRELHVETRVPHDAISFVERPYASDMNLPNGFRQPMALPEGMVPPSWVPHADGNDGAAGR